MVKKNKPRENQDLPASRLSIFLCLLPVLYVLLSGPIAGATTLLLTKMREDTDGAHILLIYGDIMTPFNPLIALAQHLGVSNALFTYWGWFGWEYPMLF